MAWRRGTHITLGVALAALMLMTVPAASALANARVRFVNARGGDGSVTLTVSVGGRATSAGGAIPFGAVSELTDVPPGTAKLSLAGGKASLDKTLADGATYTVMAFPKGANGYVLDVVRSGSPIPKLAKLRIVHAAPELGSPDIRLGKRTVAQALEFKKATRYLTFEPSAYDVAVTKPNGGDVLFNRRVSLAAGTATTIVVAGSGGSPERLIVVNDAVVTPSTAPHTGLGGLARGGGAPWLLALLAALVAGTLGGAAQLARGRRPRL